MGKLLPRLENYCRQLEKAMEQISLDRKKILEQLANYIIGRLQVQKRVNIIVICTHNSRRSHLGQIWLAVIADYLQLTADIQTFSGGTEATALNPRVVTVLKKIGFEVTTADNKVENPKYAIAWQRDQRPYIAFSKKYTTAPNPQSHFAAVMVCSEADAGCPFVAGADFRLALPFDDPKVYDDTELESEKYLERCEEIGCEMMYVLKMVKNQL